MKRSRETRPPRAARGLWTGMCTALLLGLAPPLVSAPRRPSAAPAAGTPSASPAARAAGATTPTASPSAIGEARLEHPVLPAMGRQQTLVHVSHFGRYTLRVKSQQGVALQGIDAMAGPSPLSGIPGQQDGRIDTFLDQGTYKIVTWGHEKGTGEARLEVLPFRELSGDTPPVLAEGRLLSTTLDDLEQRSYWLDLKDQTQVALEVAGRHLADLRLWKDGQWLVGVQPDCEEIEPTPARPLLDCQLVANLEPGRYRLIAYGGPSRAWGEDTPDRPLHLRYGVPMAPRIDRRRHVLSPFGVDYWRVPAGVSYYRLELPEPLPATLEVGTFRPADPLTPAGSTYAQITKKSAPPVVELDASIDDGDEALVKVTGTAGQPYVMQHFQPSSQLLALTGEGERWVGTVHAGALGDAVDATGAVIRTPRNSANAEVIDARAIEIEADLPWRRRFNLSGQVHLLLHAKDAVSIRANVAGPLARVRLEPLHLSPPRGYRQPPFTDRTGSWDLNPGYYLLQVQAVEEGAVDLTITSKSTPEGAEVQPTPVRGSLRFSPVRLEAGFNYSLRWSPQGAVRSGAVVRTMPIDLGEPLPLTQRPGEVVSIPVRVGEKGTVVAEGEDGKRLELSLDGKGWSAGLKLAAGNYTVSVKPPEERTVGYTLRLEPDRLSAPLPTLAEAKPPALPELTTGNPRHFDLEAGASKTFLVRVEKPALYEIQTTGLLATEGTLRTRTMPSFMTARVNGFGRNFLLQQYLRQGDYQLTVTALGETKGHLGLKMSARAPLEGGTLEPGATARAEVKPGDAVVYRLAIPEAGTYRMRSVGMGRKFRSRLEDAEGWALAGPDMTSEFTRRLDAGTYRVVLLPEPTATRRLTRLEMLPDEPKLEGHGPHPMPLAARRSYKWKDPEGLGEKRPDVWAFEIPAPMDAGIQLTGGIQGVITRVAPDGSRLEMARVSPWRPRVHLDAGKYQLEVSAIRKDSDLDYTVGIWPVELAPGLRQNVQAPASRTLSVAKAGLIEIGTFGMTDVRARLFDAAGKPIASSDDRPGDWNPYILERLEAGTYRLDLEPVGRESAMTTIEVRSRDERQDKPRALPFQAELNGGGPVGIYPLDAPLGPGLLTAACRSNEYIGCAIEASRGETWQTLATTTGFDVRVDVRLSEEASNTPVRYRLRVWSLDRRGSPITVGAAALKGIPAREEMLRKGLALKAQPVPLGAVAVASIEAGPGLFRLEGDLAKVRWCPKPNAACLEADNGQVSASAGPLWLVAHGPERGGNLAFYGARQKLETGLDKRRTVSVPPTAPLSVDLEAPAGVYSLVIARASSGTPCLSLAPPAGATGGSSPFTGCNAGRTSSVALAFSPAPDPALSIWRADENAEDRLEVQLQALAYPSPAPEKAEVGRLEGPLMGFATRAFELPAGLKRMRVASSEGLIAALARGTEVQEVLWADGEGLDVTLETTASHLLFFRTRSGEGRFSADIVRTAGEGQGVVIAPASPLEMRLQTAGTLRVPVAAPDKKGGWTMHVRGAVEAVTLSGPDGRVQRGVDLPLPVKGGTLVLRHRPGLVLAWIDRPGEESRLVTAGGAPSGSPANRLQPALPARVSLPDDRVDLEVGDSAPRLLHLRTAIPVVTALAGVVRVHPEGALLDVYLPAGPATLAVRALAGGTLAQGLELSTTPVTTLREGPGPEVLLPAGATRLFSFEVKEAGPVGLGVRAVPDVLSARLLTAQGVEVGRGIAQMPTLEPGTYLLELKAPASTRPVTARPAVVGVSRPGIQPPKEVAGQYGPKLPADEATLLEPPAEPVEAAAWGQPEWLVEEPAPLEDQLGVDPLRYGGGGYRGSISTRGSGDDDEGEAPSDEEMMPEDVPAEEGE